MSNKDDSYHAVVHIMKAAVYAKAGFHQDAHNLAMKAHGHAEKHRALLASTGKHHEVQEFDRKIAPMFSHLQSVLSTAPAIVPHQKPSLMSRVKDAFTPTPKSKTLNKAIIGATPKFANAVNDMSPQKTNRSPGKLDRYDYKPFSALTPANQSKAQMAFRHSPDSMDSYHYAHDKQTGEMVHGQRWLQPASAKNPPQATSPTAGAILPQHMPGAAVSIVAPGHESHGAFGEVQQPNPGMPGQIRVRTKNKQTKRIEDVFVQPHQVQMNNPLKRSEPSNVILLEKSRAALKRLKSPKES